LDNFGIGLVLVLEDEPFIALDLEEMLKAAGVSDVVSVMTCYEADAWLAKNTPELAIIDPHLKDGFCLAAARTLSARQVPFVVYSGDAASAGEREAAFNDGIWLPKPCLPDALNEAINTSLSSANRSGGERHLP
jgi:DNA-binding response OmpR family regulator